MFSILSLPCPVSIWPLLLAPYHYLLPIEALISRNTSVASSSINVLSVCFCLIRSFGRCICEITLQ
ncbi:hypothetical protein HMPREF1544_07651 [Mucor circinelloides 1006PhL]|uniref:Uncharacterized protein n=1 Tax=Mucor circinelloides f. circinelloides (strain 1006PhL) TaxID=1220926 RepID=S2JAV0_MUCC1|nr:hypothetical protein HMPREF1544_07651 [Mucor circinelloides 1006PhL]